ncbi:MAG: C-GCAxxG-C-C family protein [Brevefilum sp.]|nr:C-GCAxxG-C-C family protein [Brevefilum sp.]
MDLVSEAQTLFEGPYNCAQAVLGPFAERFGLPQETAFKITTPFGGGIGHTGQVCGAVSGAMMAIGLAQGTAIDDKSQKEACYAMARAFQARFLARHKAVTCPGLLGLDLGDPSEYAQAKEMGVFHSRCPLYVGDAVLITAELLGVD